jgi:hypothetical protein
MITSIITTFIQIILVSSLVLPRKARRNSHQEKFLESLRTRKREKIRRDKEIQKAVVSKVRFPCPSEAILEHVPCLCSMELWRDQVNVWELNYRNARGNFA